MLNMRVRRAILIVRPFARARSVPFPDVCLFNR